MMNVKKNKWILISLLLLLASCGVKRNEPFNFVQLCDTQLGMGGYEHDVLNFEQAVRQINELNVDFVVICGDLVHHASDSSYADFNRIKNGFSMPCYPAPGNHDVGKKPNKEKLTYYRKTIGKDYFTFKNKEYSFVVTNSQLWLTDVENESEKHYNWFKETLSDLGKSNTPSFVIGHYPLFINSPEEKDKNFNLPKNVRLEILEILKRNNVKGYLSGHKHETIINSYENILLVSGETTSKNFDKRPMGFRLWEVSQDSISHQFVALQNSVINQPKPN